MFRGFLENAITYRDHVKLFASSFLRAFSMQELHPMKNCGKDDSRAEITS
jgi:hypothetical protein